MTPETLTRICHWLYGSQWQSELARNLGISDNAVRYWVHPNPERRRPMREGHIRDLKNLVIEKAQSADEILSLFDQKKSPAVARHEAPISRRSNKHTIFV